jgi:heme-degrading monooxygenase HmoA
MTEFDAARAVREQLAGLADVMRIIRQREQAAEEVMSAAENELNAIRKLRGFCEIEIGRLRSRLAALEEKP